MSLSSITHSRFGMFVKGQIPQEAISRTGLQVLLILLTCRARPCTGTTLATTLRTRRVVANFWQISAKCCLFSAVSAPIFASKYAFCSIFQNLPDSQAEFLKFDKICKFYDICKNFAEFSRKLLFFQTVFLLKF